MPIQANIDKKRAERERLIDEGRKLIESHTDLSEDTKRRIIKSTVTELVDGIEQGQWTALVCGCSKRGQEARRRVSGDSQTARRIPWCSLDFQRPMQATYRYDYTIGFTHWVDNQASRDAELVAQARSLGAIIIAKTNVPQTMMGFECANPLWGTTTNPFNKDYTCGGSSGGEAAVLRFSGSALGLGSDIGGSLRIPTSYCGVYSLKPTSMRMSGQGAPGTVPGFLGIQTTYGPMARSAADIKRACELLFGLPSTSPSANLPPVKYRTDLDLNRAMRVGYFKSDRFIRASPPCQRAVEESIAALRREGHECLEINPPDVADLLKLFVEHTAADGYETMMSNLQSDKQEPALFLVTLGPRLPWFIRAITSLLAKLFINDETFAYIFPASRPRSVREFWASSAARIKANEYLQDYLWANMAPALGLDVVICPVQAVPCVPHTATKSLSPLAGGTIIWNVIDCPVGVVPVTRVDPARDATGPDWLEKGKTEGPVMTGNLEVPQNRKPSNLLEGAVYGSGKRLLQPLDEPVPVYDAEKMRGLPVGVQIVGRPWEDEKIIHVMEILDRALGERGFGPGMDEEWKL
ncbi:amidase [Ceratobasidium sp. AG-Ba]|nr:amidase [Ceratobasidium sp. AG-Ba]